MKIQKKQGITALIVAILMMAVLLMPVFNVDNAMQLPMHLVIVVCVYIFLSQSWNILAGLTGLFSLGHVAFYGIGAYSLGICTMKLNLHPLIGILTGIVLSVLMALLIGTISSKLYGFYFAMVTIALGETLRTIASQWVNMTGSINGIPLVRQAIPRSVFFYIAIVLAVISIIFFIFLRRSRVGSMFVSIRENENLAKALGVNTSLYKIIAAVISAVMASVIGAFMYVYVQVVDLSYFSSNISNKIFIVVIIGGMGSVWGPVLGSIIILLEEYMRGAFGANYAPLTIAIYGSILIFFILVRPGGLVSIHLGQSIRILKRIFSGEGKNSSLVKKV